MSTIRTMSPGIGIDPTTSTYSLSAEEAVVTSYAAWKCGGHRTGMPDFEAALVEGKALVRGSSIRTGVRQIVLPDGRAWFAFPDFKTSVGCPT